MGTRGELAGEAVERHVGCPARNSSTLADRVLGTASRIFRGTISDALRSSSTWQPAGRNGNPHSISFIASARLVLPGSARWLSAAGPTSQGAHGGGALRGTAAALAPLVTAHG